MILLSLAGLLLVFLALGFGFWALLHVVQTLSAVPAIYWQNGKVTSIKASILLQRAFKIALFGTLAFGAARSAVLIFASIDSGTPLF